ncbi:MAG: SsrA-binding protein SmpB [Anaerovoracaceae bacterium]|jgi:SsrA-binding protein
MRQKKIIVNNKKARHDYFIEEVYEAGIVLTGTEIKSIRLGKVNLKESYAKVENGELIIYGMHISPYEQGNRFNVDPLRPRKLLLHKHEIRKLIGYTTQKGLTIVPLNLYINERGIAKMEIAVAQGKKLYDKREDIAKRDVDRRIRQQMKQSLQEKK